MSPHWLGADESVAEHPVTGHRLCGLEGSRSSVPKAVLQSDDVAKDSPSRLLAFVLGLLVEARPSRQRDVTQRCGRHTPNQCHIRPEMLRAVRHRPWCIALESGRRSRRSPRPLLVWLKEQRGISPSRPPDFNQQCPAIPDEPECAIKYASKRHGGAFREYRRVGHVQEHLHIRPAWIAWELVNHVGANDGGDHRAPRCRMAQGGARTFASGVPGGSGCF